MNKEEIIKKIAEQASLSKDNAKKALEAVFQVITESLKNEEPVAISGFGTFKVTKRAATKGRNSRTGDLSILLLKLSLYFLLVKISKMQ